MSSAPVPVRALWRLCLLLTVPLALVLTSLPAQAESWTVPNDARVTISGHGYGHGHGMSQYGAEGAARQGLSHRQILSFYYPGTSVGRFGGNIRVKITADTTDDVTVMPRSGLLAHDVAREADHPLPANGATRWRLRAVGARTAVAYLRNGSWRRYRLFGGEAEFRAGGQPIRLVLPNGSTRGYRARLRSAQVTAGSAARHTVNVLSMQSYLRGVVPLEIPASWTPAAVRAQSVAARTYAAFERARPVHAYDICDTTSCQVYGGFDAEQSGSNAAVRATGGQALTYGGEWAFTQFSSSSGGWTSRGSRPYLVAQRDPYDGWSGNGVHDWRVTRTDNAVERAFPAVGNLRRIVVNRRDGNGEWGGRVESITFVGSRGRATVSGDTARWRLGLRSTWFTFRVTQS